MMPLCVLLCVCVCKYQLMGCAAARHKVISLIFNKIPVRERRREITWKTTSGHWFLRRTLLRKTQEERRFYKNWWLNMGHCSDLTSQTGLSNGSGLLTAEPYVVHMALEFVALQRRPGILSIGLCRCWTQQDLFAEFWRRPAHVQKTQSSQ